MRLIVEKPFNPPRNRGRTPYVNEDSAFATIEHPRHATSVRSGNDRKTCAHRLQENHWARLLEARVDQHRAAGKDLTQRATVEDTEKLNAGVKMSCPCSF